MKKFKKVCVFCAAVLCTLLGMSQVIKASTLKCHTQQDIIEKYKSLSYNAIQGAEFEFYPSMTGTLSAGKLTKDTLKNSLELLNFIRYTAGLPDNVMLDDYYTDLAQKGALLLAMNKKLTHYPVKPVGMDEKFYQSAKKGVQESSTACAMPNLPWAIKSFLADSDPSMLASMNNRRLLLNPYMEKTGFGFVMPSSCSGKSYAAMYSLDKSLKSSSEYDYIAWPAAQTPIELINQKASTGYAFTLAFGDKYDLSNKSAIKVTVSDEKGVIARLTASDKNLHAESYLGLSKSSYGYGSCIIFKFGSVKVDKTYEIKVEGVKKAGHPIDFDYKVHMFSLLGEHVHDKKGELLERTPATCTGKGTAFVTCSGCHEHFLVNEKGNLLFKTTPTLGHDFETVKSDKSAKEEDVKICKRCGHKEKIEK